MTPTTAPDLGGTVAEGFEPVRDAFAANFTEHGDIGAAVCVTIDGEPVVDLWGGVADVETERPWTEDTVVTVFSSTKGLTATCVHLLAERELLDLDEPVATYWPEFAAAGKEQIPVRWLLTHQAGVAAVQGEVSADDVLGWDGVVEAIAAQAPNWEPGTAHGYHARSFGWTLGEVVRRITGRSLGAFLADEIAGPLGLSFWVGLPEEIEPRCATVIPLDLGGMSLADLLPPDTLARDVLSGPSELFAGGYDHTWNQRPLRAVELPSSNGVGDARALARHYAALIGEVDGIRLLRPETVATASTPAATGTDHVLGVPLHFGLGYMVQPTAAPGAGPATFGHAGAGGSLGFADPDARVGFGYVMNRMLVSMTGDERTQGLIEALYRCL